jgi:hypothetical protein
METLNTTPTIYCDASFVHTEDLAMAKFYVQVIERFGQNPDELPFKLCEHCKNEMVKESLATRVYTVSICEITA